MGTPGDKKEIGKVVPTDPLIQPEEEHPTTTASSLSTSTSSSIPSNILVFPSTSSSSSSMGVLGRLPQFETFSTALGLIPSLSQSISKPESYPSTSASTSPIILEQAHLEDYFTQSKYYTTSVPETITTPYQIVPSQKVSEPFLDVDRPGPSGLQTQKLKKPSSSAGKLKKLRKPAGPRKTYTCQVCQKNFITLEKLNKHLQLHSGVSPFKCEHCKKTFTSKFKLVRHVLIHSESKPFKCTVCERTFHRKDHLKNHIKVHSSTKKIHVCSKPDCKKEYTSLMSYKKHLALHAAEEGSLQCQICSSVFQTKDEILYHLKIHAGSRAVKDPNEKKFTCEHCDRKFFTKKDVRRHLVVHTGMRDFLCQFCPQRFGRKDHLVRHIKKSHSKSLKQERMQTAVKKETPEAMVFVKVEPSDPHQEPLPVKQEQFPVKSEVFSEASSSDPFDPNIFPYVDVSSILEGQSFESLPFLDPQSVSEPELRDLGSNILEEIGEPSCSTAGIAETLPNPEEELLGQTVMNLPSIRELLQPSEEKNIPLPGFSETFQSSPPPPP